MSSPYVYFNKQIISSIASGQKVEFYADPGNHVLSKGKPSSGSFRGLLDPQIREYSVSVTFESGKEYYFSVSPQLADTIYYGMSKYSFVLNALN